MILWLRSLAFHLAYIPWTVLMHVLAMFPFAVGSRSGIAAMASLWVSGTLVLLRYLCSLGYQEIGARNMPRGQAIYAVKHQSAWETLYLTRRLGFPAFVLKRELLSIPVFGQFLRAAGMIAIDRAQGKSSLKKMLRDIQSTLGENRSIVIFPEGTRTSPGERRKYHAGVAALYAYMGLPVVPVALNSGLFWGRRAFMRKPGTITIEFLPVIEPGLDRQQFMAELENRVETAADRLRKA